MKKEEVLSLYASTMKQTLDYFDLSDDQLKKTYGEGKWSVQQILHHLTDSEHIFLERLKRIIAEPKQVIWAYDQDAWNDTFDYKNEALTNKKKLFEVSRELNTALVDKYYDKLSDRVFVHSLAGLRTLQTEFARVATHNMDHIKQIQKALSE